MTSLLVTACEEDRQVIPTSPGRTGGSSSSASGGRSGGDANTGGGDAFGGHSATGGAGGAATGGSGVGGGGSANCSCTLPTAATQPVVLSWDCFCDMQPQSCTGTLDDALTAARANTSMCYARAEYPGCGLTVLYSAFQLYGWSAASFDGTTGQKVGVHFQNDYPAFGCPGKPNVSISENAGRLPNCQATTCEMFGNCGISSPPPCAR